MVFKIQNPEWTAIILAGAKTPAGFAPASGPCRPASMARKCREMMAEGLLYAGQVHPRWIHYFTTAAQAARFVAVSKKHIIDRKAERRLKDKIDGAAARAEVRAGRGKAYRRLMPKTAALRDLISAKAATPEGFTLLDADGQQHISQKICARAIVDGTLFRSNPPPKKPVNYFLSAEAAQAFQATIKMPAPDRLHRAKSAAEIAQREIVTQARKQAAAEVKKLAYAKLYNIKRSPKPPPSIRQAAEIIYPAHYAKSTRLMGPGRYAVDLPMVRIGSAAWLAGVGGAA